MNLIVSKFKIVCIGLVGLLIIACSKQGINPQALEESIEKAIKTASIQYESMVKEMGSSLQYPRSINEDGTLKIVDRTDWTSGFFPGSLWYLYELNGDDKFKIAAEKFTMGLEEQQYDSSTHDTGFEMYCSYGNGLRIAKDSSYLPVLLQTARTLSTRFNNSVGCIRSWDFGSWNFPVIIDNMMNLELLYWASKVSGDTTFQYIASRHASTTMKNHYRNDYSSYHVIEYDKANGNVLKKETFQGAYDESSWARGQAWGLYGFTMAYRETGNKNFLTHAENIALYILSKLPEDYIPYWDMTLESTKDQPRDASAAAIMASALFELHQLSEGNNNYKEVAENILFHLCSPEYLAEPGTNMHFILKHSTGHMKHNSEVDAPLNYADYYFLEAIQRYKSLKNK